MTATVVISFFFHIVILFAILSTGIVNKSIFTGRTFMPGSAIQVKLVDMPKGLTLANTVTEKVEKNTETPGNKKISEPAKKNDTVKKKTKINEGVIKSQKSRTAMPELVIKEKPQPSTPTQIKEGGKGDMPEVYDPDQGILHNYSNAGNGQGTQGAKLVPGEGISGGPTVDITNFKYDYYLDIIRNRINNKWNQPIEYNQVREALIEFTINRTGKIDNIRISESSGDKYFDQTALRAVSLSNPFPPLPRGYKDNYLRVRYRFIFGRKG